MNRYFIKLSAMSFLFCILVFFNTQTLFGQSSDETDSPAEKASLSLDDIMDRVEKRYAGSGFSARFDQKSTIKAMEITDTAHGKLFVKRPDMMRWEYEAPEKQIIMTDGDTLWIYRPADKQVMTGKAPAYFGSGKGASFLSDIRAVRKQFIVSLEKKDDSVFYVLKLVPMEKKFDISAIYLSISKENFDVVKIATYNAYEDETLIVMGNFQFNQEFDNAMFNFAIPPGGVDILRLEE
ncbi:MAG: outer membrane lipoprotein chaperone LolA [Desulfobacterales bacterium]|nr:outer membrane lipoprotein chaperone LolA [Desulfobacterales bacterium]